MERDQFLEEIATLLKTWCKERFEKNDLYFDEKYCTGKTHIRFSTDTIEKILPPTDDKSGGWNNGHYILYELDNRYNKLVLRCYMSFIDLNENKKYMGKELIRIFRKIDKVPESYSYIDSWVIYKYTKIQDMDKIEQDIIDCLDKTFDNNIKDFEKKLIHVYEICKDDRSSCIISTTKSKEEGKKVQYYTTKYERSIENRKAAIKVHGTSCMACGFDFEKVYGDIGKDFIEVHHTKPLFTLEGETSINPKEDLVCVCSNCHSMIHRRKDKILTIDELKNLIRKGTNYNIK